MNEEVSKAFDDAQKSLAKCLADLAKQQAKSQTEVIERFAKVQREASEEDMNLITKHLKPRFPQRPS